MVFKKKNFPIVFLLKVLVVAAAVAMGGGVRTTGTANVNGPRCVSVAAA